MVDPETSIGGGIPDRTRKLIALDRALIEIGEPGVLERQPAELATLEARLFGAVADEEEAALANRRGMPSRRSRLALPEVRVLIGERRSGTAADDAQCLALRSQFRVIAGGQLT